MIVKADAKISNEEQEQILQTIEMFEVITQANPNDCQSLEVLKEAYWKLGRQSDAIAATRRLADTYLGLGQYASAMLEYEGILQKEPENAEVAELLHQVEGKLNQTGYSEANQRRAPDRLVLAPATGLDPSLIRTDATIGPDGEIEGLEIDLGNDGNEPLCKFLMQHRLVDGNAVQAAYERVRKQNLLAEQDDAPTLARSLIDELVESNAADMDALLSGILDRTKLAYVPLEYYEVDRQIVKMLPESLTLGRLIVPFDLISRTVMVAMANPFDSLGKEAVQQLFDYNIQWHVANPLSIMKVLGEVYRIDIRNR